MTVTFDTSRVYSVDFRFSRMELTDFADPEGSDCVQQIDGDINLRDANGDLVDAVGEVQGLFVDL
jgi:hypothetical protein